MQDWYSVCEVYRSNEKYKDTKQTDFLKSNVTGDLFTGSRSEQVSFGYKLKQYDNGTLKSTAQKRLRAVQFEDVEEMLVKYIDLRQKNDDKCGLTYVFLQAKSGEFAKQLGYEKWNGSTGWLQNVFRRNEITGIKPHSEANDMNEDEWKSVAFHEEQGKFLSANMKHDLDSLRDIRNGYSSSPSSPNDGNCNIEHSEQCHNDQHHQQHSLQNGSLRQKLRSGSSPTVGVVSCFYKDTDHVEILGLLGGYDFLWADAEQSSASPDHIASQIVAAERRGMPTLVRIGYGYQHIIGHAQKYLVAGAQGIILPQCESKSDVERIVEAVKFPPLGKRGLAGERWNSWGLGERSTLAERVRVSNENSIVAVIIENQAGIDNLSEILSVDEIDFVFVAPTDLSSNMGYPGDIRHPEVIAKIEVIGKRIREANKSAGMLALSVQDYSYWRKRGFQVMCCVAHTMFIDGAKGIMEGISNYENNHTD